MSVRSKARQFLRDRDNRWPLLLFLLGLIALGVFYYDYTRRVDIGDREVIGYIIYKNNVVQRRFADQVVWANLDNRSPLTNMDTIRSANLSDAEIHLRDGTVIKIDENSMFFLDLTGADPSIDFERGNIQIEQTGDGRVLIRQGDRTIELQDADLRIAGEEEGGLSLLVNRGNARLSVDGETHSVEADQVASVGADGVDVRQIPLRLLEPAHGELRASTGTQRIAFRWRVNGSYRQVRFQVSRYPHFNRNQFSETTTAAGAVVPLGSGTYYWRLVGTLANGRQEVSEVRKLTLAYNSPIQIASPASGSVIRYVSRPPLVSFVWSRNILASAYRLRIGTSANMSDARVIEVGSNSYGVEDLEAGTYYFDVQTIPARTGVAAVKSRVSSFRIVQVDGYAAPVLRRPENGGAIGKNQIEAGQALFIWDGMAELRNYVIQISKTRDFSSTINDATTERAYYTLQEQLDVGTYYWRVQGTGPDGKQSDFSRIASFNVRESVAVIDDGGATEQAEEGADENALKPVTPRDGARLNLRDQNQFTFRWNADPRATGYEFALYRIVNGRPERVTRRNVGNPSATITDLRMLDTGSYYYEVRSVYADGTKSEARRTRFETTLPQLDDMNPDDIEFLSPEEMYRE